MPRSIAALLACVACLFIAGCSENLPPPVAPGPPEPPRPIAVVERDDPPADRADQDTRQTGLRVMASEQRALLQALGTETRFERTSSGGDQRMRNALVKTHEDLSAIERAIAILGDEDAISDQDRLQRQDELKARLRRLATRLALIENAIRAR